MVAQKDSAIRKIAQTQRWLPLGTLSRMQLKPSQAAFDQPELATKNQVAIIFS
jgi:hypothetical protein